MKKKYENLSFEERIGQRFIFGTNTDNIDCILELIKNYHIGGVILYKRNYSSYDEMLSVIKRLKEANKNNKVPLFIAIDQEGGKVNRMPNEIHNLKNIYDVSKENSLLVSDYANIISSILFSLGINMNFGPVLDIYNDSSSGAIYKRCFYGDYDNIIKLGKRYISEFENKNIVSVIKHYPGHGATSIDSHRLIPYVFKYKDVLNKHMKPFDSLMENIDALMLGHIVVRKLTGFIPASISDKFLKKYLRDNNKYNKLIITDEINMLKRHPIYRFMYLNKVLKSSNDIILAKIKNYKEGCKIINRYKNVFNNLELNESINRILEVKQKYNINDETSNLGLDIKEINKRIDEVNSNLK